MSALYKKEPFSFNNPQNYIDISAITSALKQFLRDLPEPLIVKSIYKESMDITRSGVSASERIGMLRTLLKSMPVEHYDTLEYLIHHLNRYFKFYKSVQQSSGINLMTASNIGVVFAPSIIKTPDLSIQADIADSAVKCMFVEFLVLNVDAIFSIV
jgi:hypothetical protein